MVAVLSIELDTEPLHSTVDEMSSGDVFVFVSGKPWDFGAVKLI
jgi:hypothetical protein